MCLFLIKNKGGTIETERLHTYMTIFGIHSKSGFPFLSFFFFYDGVDDDGDFVTYDTIGWTG